MLSMSFSRWNDQIQVSPNILSRRRANEQLVRQGFKNARGSSRVLLISYPF